MSYRRDEEGECLIPEKSVEMQGFGSSGGRTSEMTRGRDDFSYKPSASMWSVAWFLSMDSAKLKFLVKYLYYSRLTGLIYILTFLLAGLLFAINLGLDTPLRDSPTILLALEATITLSLVLEVGLRAAVLGYDYLRSWSNMLDTFIAAASVIMYFGAQQMQDVELSQSLVMLRIIVQFGRILVIAEHAQRLRKAMLEGDFGVGSPLDAIDLNFANLSEEIQAKNRGENDGL
mmetsp:Transcript_110763/g.196226  ORF Transcript_110763/g.196226 Transcript_110763/m.196226 type:complete len:231 (+) Transcript_110763:55-747(+)